MFDPARTRLIAAGYKTRFCRNWEGRPINSAASFEFFVWLLATVAVYWLLPRRIRPALLVLATVAILLAIDARSLVWLAVMTGLVAVLLQFRGQHQFAALLGGCIGCVLVLLGFKLFAAGADTSTPFSRLIPLGLSYYSLRCIHVLMERYLERIDQPRTVDLISYLFFPPTIVAGPIHRFASFIEDKNSQLEPARISAGLERIVYGYAKIEVLSNYLLSTKLFPMLMSKHDVTSATYQYLDALDYGITLYLQFSGYSDIAIGFALLLGYRIIENFSWPFLRTNISAFWRSWHISLTRLCREYVFVGVHAATRRAWIGVVATMLAISFWHGLTLNYLAWGIYHAMGIVVYRVWSGGRTDLILRARLPNWLVALVGWFLTFQFVMLGFVFTKENSIAGAFESFANIAAGLIGNV